MKKIQPRFRPQMVLSQNLLIWSDKVPAGLLARIERYYPFRGHGSNHTRSGGGMGYYRKIAIGE